MQSPTNRSRWLATSVLPHEAALRSWLSAKRLNGIDVDDVVQETYSVLADLESVDHIRNPKTYMFSTANSIVLDHIRHTRVISIHSASEFEDFDFPDHSPSPETQTADRQELKRVAEAIASLTGRQRAIFVLRKVRGLPQREVAKRLGISEGAVEKGVARGLEHMISLFGRGGKSKAQASKRQSRSRVEVAKALDDQARDERGD